MAIKALIFDCFGVLVISGRQSIERDFPDKKQLFHDLTLRSDYGFVSRQDFDKELSDLTGIPLDQIEQRYWAQNVRNESVFAWVRQLKAAAEYKIGLLSNIGAEWLDDFIPLPERKELFDVEVLSGVVGMTKPDPRIYQLIADRFGVDTSECIMIDDLLQNTDGARAVGMRTVLYGETAQAKQDVERIITQQHA